MILIASPSLGEGQEVFPRHEQATDQAIQTFLEGAGEFTRLSSVSSPEPSGGFVALYDTDDSLPPDTMGAVGAAHVMTTLNTQIRIQRKDGSQVATRALWEFWAPLNPPHPFDPKVVYDPFAQRWIMVYGSDDQLANSSLLLAVSKSSDPTGQWHMWRYRNSDSETYIDYPSIGFNKDWIVVHVKMKKVSNASFSYSRFYVFSRAELYGGGPGNTRIFERGDLHEVQTPAVTYDMNLDRVYLVGTTSLSAHNNNTISIFSISGSVGNEQFKHEKTFVLPEPWTARPPGNGNFGPQLGSEVKLHYQAAWIQNVVYRKGSLWTAHHIFLPHGNPTRASVQWFELTLDSVRQRGLIDDPSGSKFYAYPSIAVNRRGDVLLGYNRFSAGEHPGAWYSTRSFSDPPNTLRGERLLKAGEGIYFKTRGQGRNRWGDYSASVVDPDDDLTFWTIQEYSLPPRGDPTLDNSGMWSTWWGRIPAPRAELRITSVALHRDNQVHVVFTIPVGQTATLQRAIGLPAGEWETLEQIQGKDGEQERLLPTSSASGFFRLKAE